MTISMKFPAGVSVAALLLLASIDAQARSLVCESEDRTTHYCAADTRGGVYLSTQFSKASCRQGSSWGYDSRGIWVSNGCRAQFDLGDYRSSHGSSSDSAAAAALALGLIGAVAIASKHDDDYRGERDYDYQPYDHHTKYGAGYQVTCESRNNQRNYCRSNLRHAEVDIDRQISRTSCRHGYNWGWDSGGVWVDDGCAAVFSVY